MASWRSFDVACALVSFAGFLWFVWQGAWWMSLGWLLSAVLAAWSAWRDGTGRMVRLIVTPADRRVALLAIGLRVSAWSMSFR
ncbi:hypothetical protein [Acidithiobacillus acidisediminis]|jgi:hypothetical protein|uniref:hypothetical protein n=1 Tax=Acidithiobacillus acidisediminis TaxID=2937799 RepID=UPI00200C1CA2|nr:hypothetical protein [Acidithiobacillus sp. S30A2]